jgi:hypothetical protein
MGGKPVIDDGTLELALELTGDNAREILPRLPGVVDAVKASGYRCWVYESMRGNKTSFENRKDDPELAKCWECAEQDHDGFNPNCYQYLKMGLQMIKADIEIAKQK